MVSRTHKSRRRTHRITPKGPGGGTDLECISVPRWFCDFIFGTTVSSRRHFSRVCLPSRDFPSLTMPKIDVFFLFWETDSRRMRATKKKKLWIFLSHAFTFSSNNPKFGQNAKSNLFIIFWELNSVPFSKSILITVQTTFWRIWHFACTYTHIRFPPFLLFLRAFFFLFSLQWFWPP